MKRKLNASDECSKATATTAGLTFASQSLSSPEHPAHESRCQVAFCEQTAREMTELVDYWQAVESAQKERSPVPAAPVGNSLFAWSDDEDDSIISFDRNLQRQLFSDGEDDDEYQERVNASLAEVIAEPLDSFTRGDQSSTMATELTSQTHHLSSGLIYESRPSSPTSLDETSSLPSEIQLCSAESSPDWLGSKTEKKIVQIIHAASQKQTQQVNQVTQRTTELEQQVHTTLMNSPLFQRYNRRSPFQKQRQDVLRAIDVALDQQASSPIVSSFPRCWQDHCDLWLRYGWHRLEDKLHLGLWEWVPLEWLTLYYYVWARPSAQTRWTVLFAMAFILMILLYNLPSSSKVTNTTLVHFSNKDIFATKYPDRDTSILEDWLL
ncbi:hypothetical protein FisN_22Lh004 [Fistulifera solaris]|uniref:Uncharacterized protein n=1 Tax=Fistulifera solaris TaxID=1519565 RepID=A0A1Z5JBJ9_FISSO|nr:hypothetical protein FisN_22Lh004 [Fistulifera solaris]|eukprot:GAX11336.1 hypothetical protein FisN_22Lh004 [Fistulifera solaris]